MANSAADRILFVPGKLCVSPSDLTTAFPHGGTALGLTRGVVWRPGVRQERIEAEEFACAVETLYTSESGILSCVTRELDNDMASQLFVDTATGQSTGRTILRGRATTDDYRSQLRTGVALYFSPDDPLSPGVYLYRAVPMIEEASEVNLALGTEYGIMCAWLATPDSDGNVKEVGPRADISAEVGF